MRFLKQIQVVQVTTKVATPHTVIIPKVVGQQLFENEFASWYEPIIETHEETLYSYEDVVSNQEVERFFDSESLDPNFLSLDDLLKIKADHINSPGYESNSASQAIVSDIDLAIAS